MVQWKMVMNPNDLPSEVEEAMYDFDYAFDYETVKLVYGESIAEAIRDFIDEDIVSDVLLDNKFITENGKFTHKGDILKGIYQCGISDLHKMWSEGLNNTFLLGTDKDHEHVIDGYNIVQYIASKYDLIASGSLIIWQTIQESKVRAVILKGELLSLVKMYDNYVN